MEIETVKLGGFSMADIKDSVAVQPVRRRLPDERQAIVNHFNVGGYEGYLTVGLYEEGQPGETSSSPREGGGRGRGRALAAAPAPPGGCNGANGDAPVCKECGGIMNRSGSCYRCANCGSTSESL